MLDLFQFNLECALNEILQNKRIFKAQGATMSTGRNGFRLPMRGYKNPFLFPPRYLGVLSCHERNPTILTKRSYGEALTHEQRDGLSSASGLPWTRQQACGPTRQDQPPTQHPRATLREAESSSQSCWNSWPIKSSDINKMVVVVSHHVLGEFVTQQQIM